MFSFFAEVAQLVEHQLPKLEVAGSSPVFRCFFGRVAKWFKAWACKAYIRRFESDRALVLRIIKKRGISSAG